jgi:hypothetical protein
MLHLRKLVISETNGFITKADNPRRISWWVFAWAGTVALGFALILVGFHAIRTAGSNPVRALRSE